MTSATELGKRVGEKDIAPAGTRQGITLRENRPARTAGSCAVSRRASSGPTLRRDRPRNASPASGPAASRAPVSCSDARKARCASCSAAAAASSSSGASGRSSSSTMVNSSNFTLRC
ncbi:MAG TPA: hypothetical protein VF069_21605 [Streptosporangiaceae bacterium]